MPTPTAVIVKAADMVHGAQDGLIVGSDGAQTRPTVDDSSLGEQGRAVHRVFDDLIQE